MTKETSTKTERANMALQVLLEEYPGLAVDESPAEWHEGTNLVRFGTYDGQPAAIKYFEVMERKLQEEKALNCFASTGLVPNLLPVESDRILVIERLPGRQLYEVQQELDEPRIQGLHRQLGGVVATLVESMPAATEARTDLTAGQGYDYRFYCQAALPLFFDSIVEQAQQVFDKYDVPDRDILMESLRELRDKRDAILIYPSFLQMDDFNGVNIIADEGRLQGCVDLEMTRYGNEVFVLAAALARAVDEGIEQWRWFREGYEDERGTPLSDELLSLVRIAAPFGQWIRVVWYWTWGDGIFDKNAPLWPIRDIKNIKEALSGYSL